MQSILLKIDESINLIEFISKIQSIYGSAQIEPVLNTEPQAKPFGKLPDIFSNPVTVDNFHMYSKEELNER